MPSDQVLTERFARLGTVFRSGDAVASGISWRDLYSARDRGLIVDLSRGLFRLGESGKLAHEDFVVVCARARGGMICLGSALSYWGLSDEKAGPIDFAVPTGSHRPRIDRPETLVHVFHSSTFELGRMWSEVQFGAGFWMSDPVRTLVDCFRLRSTLGEDVAAGALRRYVRRGDASPGALMEMASHFRVRPVILHALRYVVG